MKNIACGVAKCLLIFMSILIILFLLITFISLSTFDGKTYTQNDWVYYYVVTPGLFYKTPDLSDEITYETRGDDNYGYELNRITWDKIDDVPAAQKVVEQFFIKSGYTERQNGKIWRTYWSDIPVEPGFCPSDQYSIVRGHHSLSIELVTISQGC